MDEYRAHGLKNGEIVWKLKHPANSITFDGFINMVSREIHSNVRVTQGSKPFIRLRELEKIVIYNHSSEQYKEAEG